VTRYYAFKPRTDGIDHGGLTGLAPTGTDGNTLFELKTDAGAIRRARRLLGATARVFRYWNFFDDDTFTRIDKGQPMTGEHDKQCRCHCDFCNITDTPCKKCARDLVTKKKQPDTKGNR